MTDSEIHTLINLFDELFFARYNTRLVIGDHEPIYLPSDPNCSYNQLVFAHGYFSSALHEISHWCLAGDARRCLVDFGYWYEPDGRNEQQQKAFEEVEVKPQAIEWIFSRAADRDFYVSLDNLNGIASDSASFKQKVYKQVLFYCEHGLPERAELFRRELCVAYGTPIVLDSCDFVMENL